MNTVLLIITLSSFVFALFSGSADRLSLAATSSAAEAVSLIISLTGGLCFWSGLMRLADKAGICSGVKKLLTPLLKIIFPRLDTKGKAANLISMNITSNLLGLGNAATPLGIAAMKELSALNQHKNIPSDDMVTFAVINSSSLQILPTTLATLRAAHSVSNPLNILPAIICSSIASLAVGVFFARIVPALRRKR